MSNRFVIFCGLLILFSSNAFGRSGGSFAITESVIAGGGGQNSALGAILVDGSVS